MSAKNPYVIGVETPKELKKLISRVPQVLRVFENILADDDVCRGVFFEDVRTVSIDDPLLEWSLDQLSRFELIKKSDSSKCGYSCLYSKIVLERDSFEGQEKTDYNIACLKEQKATVFANNDKNLIGGSVTGSLSKEKHEEMMKRIIKVVNEYATEENGEYAYTLSIVSQEI